MITAANQSFQYLFSVAMDAKIDTVAKLRIAKKILSKIFPTVNQYELAKAEPVKRVKELDNQIQLIFNANKQTEKAEDIETMKSKRQEILDNDIAPLSQAIVFAILTEEEVTFVKTEMTEFLAEAKKFGTMEEMEMFDSLFTALEEASEVEPDTLPAGVGFAELSPELKAREAQEATAAA